MIESLQDIRRAASEATFSKFKRSVRPILRHDSGRTTTQVATGILLSIKSRKFLVTAAHVPDTAGDFGFSVLGWQEASSVPLQTGWRVTTLNGRGREDDPLDFAYIELSGANQKALGGVEFLNSSVIASNVSQSYFRNYTVIGFPASSNRRAINRPKKFARESVLKFFSMGEEIGPSMVRRGFSHSTNLALAYEKLSLDESGNTTNTVKPDGLSGGLVFDHGEIREMADYHGKEPNPGRPIAMVIELNEQPRALICVRLAIIVSDICRSHGIQESGPATR